MDANLLRNVGITIGAAALAGALAVSQVAREPVLERVPDTASSQLAPIDTSAPPHVVEEPMFETAGADAPPAVDDAPVSFLVRFQGSGPLGQAQALAERGREAEARSAAQGALARQSTFRGLCFDRFTVGGAEMVLRSCAGVSPAERAQVSAQWLARLRAISAVAYAEANATADPAQPR